MENEFKVNDEVYVLTYTGINVYCEHCKTTNKTGTRIDIVKGRIKSIHICHISDTYTDIEMNVRVEGGSKANEALMRHSYRPNQMWRTYAEAQKEYDDKLRNK